jgi:hypothetical protein
MSGLTRPVTLIIADTSPLLSLAVVDRLDLLQSFGAPVFVTDVVKYECLRYENRAGVQRLIEWFNDGGGNQYRVVPTVYGPAYLAARKLEEDGSVPNATGNIGEQSITWTIDHLADLAKGMGLNPGDHYGLILSDDNDYANSVPPLKFPENAHLLSSRAFFVALATLGFISSSSQLTEEVKASGRPRMSKANRDRPGKIGKAITDYREGMEKVLELDDTEDNDSSGPKTP